MLLDVLKEQITPDNTITHYIAAPLLLLRIRTKINLKTCRYVCNKAY